VSLRHAKGLRGGRLGCLRVHGRTAARHRLRARVLPQVPARHKAGARSGGLHQAEAEHDTESRAGAAQVVRGHAGAVRAAELPGPDVRDGQGRVAEVSGGEGGAA